MLAPQSHGSPGLRIHLTASSGLPCRSRRRWHPPSIGHRYSRQTPSPDGKRPTASGAVGCRSVRAALPSSEGPRIAAAYTA
eukprot:scaffold23633_cov75-Phaeocystis_antarctica.AAC.4